MNEMNNSNPSYDKSADNTEIISQSHVPLNHVTSEIIPKLNVLFNNRYEFIKKIGEGGMGIVFLAKDTKLNRLVAIKTISLKHYVERFKFEALISVSLKHPNIVEVHEVIEIDNLPLFIMEYIEGTALDEYVKENKLDYSEILKLMIPICKGIAKAHSKGIIHRDLKPSNIIVTREGEPKILDFGLAKVINETAELNNPNPHTQEGTIIGSGPYMSPEQAKGAVTEIDIRSDIFSLGVILYKLFTGEFPFKGSSNADIVYKIINADTCLPTKYKPQMPLDVEAICMKAIEKNPCLRYQTIQEIIDDIRNYLKGSPVKARKYTFKEKSLRAINKRKEMFIISIVLIWIMFFGIIFSSKMIHNISKESIKNELQIKMRSLANTGALLINGNIVEIIKTNEDLKRKEVIDLISVLKNIKNRNEKIEYTWLMRPSGSQKGYAEFIAEDITLDAGKELDRNNNGIVEESEKPCNVGEIYKETQEYPNLLKSFYEGKALADENIRFSDFWGINLSGYAPIRNSNGDCVAILGLDLKSDTVASSFKKIDKSYFQAVLLAFIFALLLNVFVTLWIIALWNTNQRLS
ncbi:MAG: putative serine/threonine protein kinase [uncultured bacterium]|nr:MAG: putative serine/threonine protein kinase [uncultured bacterium]